MKFSDDKVASNCFDVETISKLLSSYICYMPTVQLLIKGKVQGVFYRATARQIADRIGITGWIKNTREGNVEATVSGTEEQLKKFISWCKKGSEKAVVDEVVITEKEETLFDEFVVVH